MGDGCQSAQRYGVQAAIGCAKVWFEGVGLMAATGLLTMASKVGAVLARLVRQGRPKGRIFLGKTNPMDYSNS